MAKKRTTRTKAKTIDQLIVEMETFKDRGKAEYAKYNRVCDELVPLLKQHRKGFSLKDGRTAELVDNFAKKNKHYGSVGVSRFEIVVSRS